MSESMEAGYSAILLLFSFMCACDSISTATWSATAVAASLAHLTGVLSAGKAGSRRQPEAHAPGSVDGASLHNHQHNHFYHAPYKES
jgi:hypothetical protein